MQSRVISPGYSFRPITMVVGALMLKHVEAPSMPGISAPLSQGLELASDILRRMWLWVVSNTNTRRRSR